MTSLVVTGRLLSDKMKEANSSERSDARVPNQWKTV